LLPRTFNLTHHVAKNATWRFDARQGIAERVETPFPSLDRGVQSRIRLATNSDFRAFNRIQRSEHILGRQSVDLSSSIIGRDILGLRRFLRSFGQVASPLDTIDEP
jgi:hypothetical protein